MPETSQPAQQWFVLKVAPQHELAVLLHLQAKGLEAAVPTYTVRRRWSDRLKTLTLPLFPGYVFCRFATERRVPVMNTPGVRGAITFGSQLAALDNHEMERIQKLASAGLTLEALAGLRTGCTVRIVGGPLNGMHGVLAHVNGSSRVVVNVELLNRCVSVQVEPDSIEPAHPVQLSIPA